MRQNWSYSHLVIVVCFPYIEGTTQENLDKLIQNVHIESDSDMIKNWKYLDVPVISSVRMYLFLLYFPTVQGPTPLLASLSNIIQVWVWKQIIAIIIFFFFCNVFKW